MAQWQWAFHYVKPVPCLMSCLLPTHIWTLCLQTAGTCWTMESKQSRAEGGHELTIQAAGNFGSTVFYLAALASLKAVWKPSFHSVLAWSAPLGGLWIPTPPSALQRCFLDMRKTWSTSPPCSACVTYPLLPSPRAAAACAQRSSSDPAQLQNPASDCWNKAVRKSVER